MTEHQNKTTFFERTFPIVFAVIVFLVIAIVYYFWIFGLNLLPGEKIQLQINTSDILVGLTIYLKTAVDFALVIGILMKNFPGLKNRLAIETGTAVGNALGTAIILAVWYFFKEIVWLLAIMVVFASLVLLKLAQTSLEHLFEGNDEHDQEAHSTQAVSPLVMSLAKKLNNFLTPINSFLSPILSKVVPDMHFDTEKKLTFWGLVMASFSIPFILGLDDFAGYVPLFNVVNVFGFGIGVFLGHCVLNIFLFLNPNKTISIVKNPIIAVLGSAVFIGLSFWGLYEAGHLLKETYLHIF